MAPTESPLTLTPEAAERIRLEIARAGGREVCFLAEVTTDRRIVDPRAVARGNHAAVLAAARDVPDGGIMLHNHPSGLLEPSDADLSVAGRLFHEGLGTGIVDNDARNLYVVVEPPRPRVVVPLDVDELTGLLGPDGPLASLHGGYEDREGQREMLARVAARYNDGGVAMVEAGTGTGKSLAYLIPAAVWALRNGERTVISTNTINLQEQLVDKDLPLVRLILEEDLRWSLVKGRGNYISIRRARLAAESQGQLFEDDRSGELGGLLEWIETTADGSLSDLSAPPSDEVWDEVRSDADICLRTACPHFQQCFFQRSRREAAAADLLVVNHHLLFADLSVRRATENYTQSAVLPAYRRLVLDEAHNVEDAATSHLGVELTRSGLFRMLARLDRNGKGVLTAIHDSLTGGPDGPDRTRLMARIEDRVRPALDDARAILGLFFDDLEAVLPDAPREPIRLGSDRCPEPIERPAVRERLDGLLDRLSRLGREVSELLARIELDEEWRGRLVGRVLDLRSIERRLSAASGALRLVLDPSYGGDAYVRWTERRGRGSASGREGRGRGSRRGEGNVVLAAAPIEPGPLLRESLFDRVESAVLTSATLTTRKRFDFLKSRLGLLDDDGEVPLPPPPPGAWPEAESGSWTDAGAGDGEPDGQVLPGGVGRDHGEGLVVVEASIPSPFDFESQSVLCVPSDLPDPREGGDALDRVTARTAEALASVSGGGLFVLFTSHRSLRNTAELMRSGPGAGRWPLFVQGEANRSVLLGRFVESGSGILLGTTSFWEGVDVPGRPLRGLVIQKLPFRVPTEPVTEARVEALERTGRDPFWDYALPIAALKLKQGFGRLIRARTDRGAVVLLDHRILTRRYGRYLRESLPPAPLVKGPWWEVERRLRAFYAPGAS